MPLTLGAGQLAPPGHLLCSPVGAGQLGPPGHLTLLVAGCGITVRVVLGPVTDSVLTTVMVLCRVLVVMVSEGLPPPGWLPEGCEPEGCWPPGGLPAGWVGWGTSLVLVTGQTVVDTEMVSVVTWPMGQLVTLGGHLLMVYVLVV